MTTLSTHVLDAALGRPAAGVAVTLDGATEASTDPDGRLRFNADLEAGDHSLVFATGDWFAASGRDTFLPQVTVGFTVDPEQAHYHVALLLSPFSYTTYRGS